MRLVKRSNTIKEGERFNETKFARFVCPGTCKLKTCVKDVDSNIFSDSAVSILRKN